jgi:uncharacterized membrane protein required for colicin V production
MSSSQILDLFSVIVIGFFTIKGSSRGLISQITWIGALLLCFKFSGVLTPIVEPAVAVDPPLRKWIAMAIVYVGLCLCVFVVAGIFRGWLKKAKLNDFDKHLGSILGMSIGIVVCMTSVFFLLTLWPSSQELVRNSWTGKTASVIVHQVDPLLRLTPDGAEEQLRDVFKSYHEKLHSDDELTGGTESDEEVFGSEGEAATGGGLDFASWLGQNQTEPSSPAGTRLNPSLQDLLGQLTPTIRDSLTQRVLQAWDSATSDERRQLLGELGQTVPAQTESLLDDFTKIVRSNNETGGAGRAVELSRQDLNLLKEIDEIYGPARRVGSQAKRNLIGVPAEVQHSVLEDWYADVMILQADPDTGTDVTTRFDERIVRQLLRHRVSLDRLDGGLRQRLSQLDR